MSSVAARLFARLFATQDTLSEQDTRRSFRLLTVHGVAAMSMTALLGGPFLGAFAIAMGASNYEIGLLASIGMISQFMQLPGLYLVKKVARRRAIMVLATATVRLAWLPVVLIPVLFLDRGVTFLIQWLFIATMVGALAVPAWNSLLRDIVPTTMMGRVFARRMMLGTGSALVLTLGGGYFVDMWKTAFPDAALYAYSLVFGLGILFGVVATSAVARLPEPTMAPQGDESLLALLAEPLKDRNFRSLLAFVAAWSFSINLAAPFFIIYMMKRLNMPVSMVTVMTVVSQLVNLLFLRIWGRLADRYSNKSVLALSGPLFLVAVLGWTFTTMPEKHTLTLPLLFAIHALSGMSLAGVSLASANIALKLSPSRSAHSYMTVHGMVAAMTGATAPLVGGALADFFSTHEFSIAINWAGPETQLSMYALNLRALDFLFVIAFVLGLYSMHRLAHVREKGEVTQAELREELLSEVAAPFRSAHTVLGIRHLATLPLSAIHRFSEGRRRGPEQ